MEWPKITKDTPLEEVKRIHQLIWDYAIEYGRKPSTPYLHNCVACEYARIFGKSCRRYCPIAWKDENVCGIYDLWCDATVDGCSDLAKVFATEIRNMPFKYELNNSQKIQHV